jgi:hypothetical protein
MLFAIEAESRERLAIDVEQMNDYSFQFFSDAATINFHNFNTKSNENEHKRHHCKFLHQNNNKTYINNQLDEFTDCFKNAINQSRYIVA